MVASLPVDKLPLELDNDGVIRVGGTRVTLDVILSAFRVGASPETIAECYPSVSLGNVYESIGYALQHPGEIATYLSGRESVAATVRAENLRRFPQDGVRARLLARRENGVDH